MKVLSSNYTIDETIQTIVGRDSQLSGIINTENAIRIEGGFSGEINSQGTVYIGLNSTVKANINALKVVVAGEILGDVEVVDSIEIFSTGKIIGNITGKKLIVE